MNFQQMHGGSYSRDAETDCDDMKKGGNDNKNNLKLQEKNMNAYVDFIARS